MSNGSSRIPPTAYTPLGTSNTGYSSIQVEEDLESGSPRRVSHNGVEISDVTGEEPRPSFLFSCWSQLINSVYTFFSYVSYYLTCCFWRGSFRDVTRNQEQGPIPNEDQVRAASTLREYSSKSVLLRECAGHYQGRILFYTTQKDLLLNYLQFLRAAVSDLVNTLQNKNEDLREETETTLLITEIIAKLQFLKSKAEYEALAIEIENRILNDERLENEAVKLSAKKLSTAIMIQLYFFEGEQIVNNTLLEKINLLFDHNQQFLDDEDQNNSISIANINTSNINSAELELLARLNENSLTELRERSEGSQQGLLNNMIILQSDIEGYARLINRKIAEIRMQRTQEEQRRHAQAYRTSSLSRFKL